jgi:DNA-binding NtrC family response regulator
MNVDSRPNEGSRFEVWLPRATAAVSMSEPGAAALPTGKGKAVMLVARDDDCMLRDEEMLAALGYEAVGFVTADAALAACRANPGRFDMAVVGQLGSIGQTIELATALHVLIPRLPIVIAINSAIEISADTLMTAGISDVVRWPIVAEEIAITLAQNSTWSSVITYAEPHLLPSPTQ